MATLIFYPFDVAKTRLQADADSSVEGDKTVTQGSSSSSATTTTSTDAQGQKHEAAPCVDLATGERTYFGELRVFMRQPQLWYAGLGTS